MSNIDTLVNLGEDAFTVFWDILFTPVPAIASIVGLNDTLRFRCESVSIPSTGHETYDVRYGNMKIPKTSPLVEDTKEISINFRADRNMLIYKALKTWKNLTLNTNDGSMAPDAVKTPVTIQMKDHEDNIISTWVLEGCRVKEIGDIGFDRTSNDPLSVSVTLVCDLINDTAA